MRTARADVQVVGLAGIVALLAACWIVAAKGNAQLLSYLACINLLVTTVGAMLWTSWVMIGIQFNRAGWGFCIGLSMACSVLAIGVAGGLLARS
jgi:hypothetical protein